MKKRLLLLACAFMLFFFSLQAQKPEDIKVSKNLVIENVMLVSKPGMQATPSTIVIKDGLIHLVGSKVSVPSDAIKIKGDSLYAYSAFIDACSHTGLPKPEKDEKRDRPKDPGNPTWEQAGITPHQEVHSQLNMSDGSVKRMREAGFAISHVVPRGRMLPGQGSVVLLKEDNTIPYISRNQSMFGSLKSAQGRVYPSTVIAVMAKYRDLFQQAKNASTHVEKSKMNPVGLARPSYDDEIQALFPVQSGKMPFFFMAEKTLDISRALTLNEDLKSQMIIVEAKQAWPNLETLKSKNTTLLLSLELPEEMKEEKKDSTAVVDPKKDALIARKKESIENYRNQAKMLHDKGINYSYSYFDVRPKDIMKNLMTIKESGISEKELLSQLTTKPAKMLGIDRVAGTLEAGKLANIILTDKPIFEKDMNIHYTIVEGESFKHEVKEKTKKKKGSGEASEGLDLEGEWKVVAKIPDQEENAQLFITKNRDSYSGKLIDSEGETTEIEEISVDGNAISFTFEINNDGFTLQMEVTADIDGKDLEGKIKVGEFGSFPFEGTKVSPKN